ncbi:hypothetical protein [Candidatus Odyssella thessalonicensis]|uniref:hypothetical protein n=1 Tax=Candidatus Odyssella thessalonicensis TaxID=84647 RepID=UPI000225B983|nr:hypothetical protein [Candidatus Odyssella thessalonicensis]
MFKVPVQGEDKSYLKLGLAVLGFLVLTQGLCYAGFEKEMETYTKTLLGNPFHYACAVLFGYTSLPLIKQNEWGGVCGRAGLCILADVILNQIFGGELTKWISGATS